MHSDIERVGGILGLKLEALRRASDLASKTIGEIREFLLKKFPLPDGGESDVDVVFLGSYARGEATKGSDRDYLVILHNPPDPHRPPDFIRAVESICTELSISKAGAQGLFAEIAIGAELYTRIGLEADTNVNISRRLLLLTESVSAYSQRTHDNLIQKVIDRYCIDYDEVQPNADPARVPRFLLNDLVRYWRTIAVDFGAKRWQALAQDWHVRYAKLLISRKVMFAGALASVFRTPAAAMESVDVRTHLFNEFKKPSLARITGFYESLGAQGRDAIRAVLSSYNRFIEILDGQQVDRKALAKVETPDAAALLEETKELGKKIEEALEVIFYDDPLFAKLTRHYGLF